MTSIPNTQKSYSALTIKNEPSEEIKNETILCEHCKRTATNGVKCKGICVADSD